MCKYYWLVIVSVWCIKNFLIKFKLKHKTTDLLKFQPNYPQSVVESSVNLQII